VVIDSIRMKSESVSSYFMESTGMMERRCPRLAGPVLNVKRDGRSGASTLDHNTGTEALRRPEHLPWPTKRWSKHPLLPRVCGVSTNVPCLLSGLTYERVRYKKVGRRLWMDTGTYVKQTVGLRGLAKPSFPTDD